MKHNTARDTKGCRPAAQRNTKGRTMRIRERPWTLPRIRCLAAEDPNFPISMDLVWAERMVVRGPPGPPTSSASEHVDLHAPHSCFNYVVFASQPFGQVPALQDGDLILFESRAISKYVLRKNNSELLKGDSLSDSATVDVWLEVESHQYDRPMAVIIFQCLIVPVYLGGETDAKLVEENLEKLKKTFEVYEARLSKFKYIAGDFISLADLSHFPTAYYFLATPHASLLDEYPHVKAWINDILARPTVKKVVEMMKATA